MTLCWCEPGSEVLHRLCNSLTKLEPAEWLGLMSCEKRTDAERGAGFGLIRLLGLRQRGLSLETGEKTWKWVFDGLQKREQETKQKLLKHSQNAEKNRIISIKKNYFYHFIVFKSNFSCRERREHLSNVSAVLRKVLTPWIFQSLRCFTSWYKYQMKPEQTLKIWFNLFRRKRNLSKPTVPSEKVSTPWIK